MGGGLILSWLIIPAQADNLGYDRYAELYKEEPSTPSWAQNVSANFLAAPFHLIKWPADKSLVWMEDHHIFQKTQWIYEQIEKQGVTPHLTNYSSIGADFDLVRILRQKENFPDLTVSSWINYGHDLYFQVGAKVGLDHILDTGFHTYGVFQYEKRPEEPFYGIGPDTSKGEGSNYEMETTFLQAVTGYSLNPSLTFDFQFAFQNVNISEGQDDGRGQIKGTYSPKPIHGIDGDEIITLGVEVNHDTRNHKENSTIGGQRRFSFSFNEGVDDSEARYFKYQAELSQYLPLWSKRRVLVFHFFGEHNAEVGNGEVPFHQMPRLGGSGSKPYLSHTLRGYDENRFTDETAALLNIEYRYTIWEHRDFKMDSTLFWDAGQTFGEFSEMQFSDFRENYGLGLRFSVANLLLLSMEVAHGDEGTNFYVRSNSPF